MQDDSLIDGLLDRWEAAKEAGQEIAPEELCREYPQLLEEVRKCIARLGAFAEFDGAPSLCERDRLAASLLVESPIDFGRYTLLKRLGAGGMGQVWLAEQKVPVRRTVAIKIIKTAHASAEAIARFEMERQALAMMDHPHIAQVFDGGTTVQGVPYLVMELIEGGTITQVCGQDKLPLTKRLELFMDVCSAVQHAHQKSIVHRDLKPSNILVSKVDNKYTAKVIDFGLAKALSAESKLTDRSIHTEFGQLLGTVLYMSPEQLFVGENDIDTRTDVYSLGVILYELLTGSTPIPAESLMEQSILQVVKLVRESEPPTPSQRLRSSSGPARNSLDRSMELRRLQSLLKGDLDWIVMKALEKDRNRRYSSADGLRRDVERFLNDLPVEARPPSALYRAKKFYQKHRLPMLVAIFLSLATLTAATAIGWTSLEVRRQSEIATRAEQARRTQEQVSKALMLRTRANQGQAGWSWLNELEIANWPRPVDPSITQLAREEIARIACCKDFQKSQVVFSDMRVGALAFNADSSLLAAGERTSTFGLVHIRIYDTTTWELRGSFAVAPSLSRVVGQLETDGVTSLEFSRIDSERESLWVGTRAGEVILLDLTTQRVLDRWKAHEANIDDFCVVDQGAIIITSSRDSLVKWWNVDTKSELKSFKANGNRYLGRLGDKLLVNNNGPTVVPLSPSANGKPVKLGLDVNSRLLRPLGDWGILSTNGFAETMVHNTRGQLLRKFYLDRFPGDIATVKVGGENQFFLLYNSQACEVWDLLAGHRVGQVVGASIDSVELDPNQPRFLVADDGELTVYRLRADSISQRLPPFPTRLEAIEFLPDCGRLVTVSKSLDSQPQAILGLWDVASLTKSAELKLPTTRYGSIFVDADASHLYYLDEKDQLTRLNLARREKTIMATSVDEMAFPRLNLDNGRIWLAYHQKSVGLLPFQKFKDYWQLGLLDPAESSLISKWSNQKAAIVQGYSRFHDMVTGDEQVAAISRDRLLISDANAGGEFLEYPIDAGALQRVVFVPSANRQYLIVNDRGELLLVSIDSQRAVVTPVLSGLGSVTEMVWVDEVLLIANTMGELYICDYDGGKFSMAAVIGPFPNAILAIKNLNEGRFALLVRNEISARLIHLRQLLGLWRSAGMGLN